MAQPDNRQFIIGIRREYDDLEVIYENYAIDIPFRTNEIKIKCVNGTAMVLLRRAPSNQVSTITSQNEVSNENLENPTTNTNSDASSSSNSSVYSAVTIQSSQSAPQNGEMQSVIIANYETPIQNTGNPFADDTQTGDTQAPVRNHVTNGLDAGETPEVSTRTNHQVATVNPMERPSTSTNLPATDKQNITRKRRRDESSSENSTDDDDTDKENTLPRSKIARHSDSQILTNQIVRTLTAMKEPKVLIGAEHATNVTCVPITLKTLSNILLDKPNGNRLFTICHFSTENKDASLFASKKGIHLIPIN